MSPGVPQCLFEHKRVYDHEPCANPGLPAIWDNRSVFHSATFDYDGLGERFGNRVVGIGEKPFFDPDSKSKAEALAAEGDGVL